MIIGILGLLFPHLTLQLNETFSLKAMSNITAGSAFNVG